MKSSTPGKQTPTSVKTGGSSKQSTATGSGSRPMGGNVKIPSSYPKNMKNIRG